MHLTQRSVEPADLKELQQAIFVAVAAGDPRQTQLFQELEEMEALLMSQTEEPAVPEYEV